MSIDVGAGIGRVANAVLALFFDTLDLLEPSPRLLEQARASCTKLGRVWCCGAQDVSSFPCRAEERYDVIWCQWVVMYLTDEDLIQFLHHCREHFLKPNGLILIKENVLQNDQGAFELDLQDHSITRCLAYYQILVERAGLRVASCRREATFPSELYPIYTMALMAVDRH